MEVLETRMESGQDGLFHYGKFYFPHVKKGQGITLANSLRRVLLYDLNGFGITHARISQISGSTTDAMAIHEFSSIPGLRESVFELLLNLRAVVWSGKPEMKNSQIFRFSSEAFGACMPPSAEGPTKGFILRAKHLREINETSGPFNIVNPEHYLGTIMLSKCPDFEIEYTFNSALAKSGTWLPTEGNFFPVKRVNYSIEDNPDFTESVFIEIWTNGAIDPKTALTTGFDILVQLFQSASGTLKF